MSAFSAEAPAAPLRVDIAIVTRDRPALLAQLLESLDTLILAEPVPEVRIVVVDNAPDATAAEVCREAADRGRFPLLYIHEKRCGIPQARNAALRAGIADADCIAFIDDDELPHEDWLAALLFAQARWDADVVTGPSEPWFENGAPGWIVASGFFEPPAHADGAVLTTAYTNNVLVRTRALANLEPLFDERLALTGSSDSEFFGRVARAGRSIRWCAGARTRERIGPTRARAGWILQRSFRHGNAAGFVGTQCQQPARSRWSVAAQGVWCLVRGSASLAWAALRGRAAWVKPLTLASVGCGLLASSWGVVYEEYRQIHGGDDA
ncbi:MAG: glycosyltransferase family A protein [Myxococcota bacterium]